MNMKSEAAHNIQLIRDLALIVQFSVWEGQYLPWYLTWENITVIIMLMAYLDFAEWITAAASATVCGVRGQQNWVVVIWPTCKLLAKKKNWWQSESSRSIWLNHNWVSPTTIMRSASSNMSILTWIWTPVAEHTSKCQLCSTFQSIIYAQHLWILPIICFYNQYIGI